MIKRIVGLALVSAAIIGAGLGIARGLRAVMDSMADVEQGEVPNTVVRRGEVSITVIARGELQGGGVRPIDVPRGGAAELPITFLRDTGELLDEGDVVVEFDTTGQDYALVEAEADLEEAQQQLLEAEAKARIALEEARLAVSTAEADLKVAELDQRENEFLGTVQQRQNQISLERARNRLEQALQALTHRESTFETAADSQRALVQEAIAKADTARPTTAELTLRAPLAGYVEVAPNTVGLSYVYTGMQLPVFQVGDAARPGMTIAMIPDMSRWEVTTQIPETDRTFLEVDQRAVVSPKAMPGREFAGHISLLGGSGGSAWNRTFNCRIALDEMDDDLRPGMTVEVRIDVETLEDVLWVPSQAVFEREGRGFVYEQTPDGYLTHEITLVRRTESRAVVTGIDEGTTIALAEPGQPGRTGTPGGPLGALPQ